MDCKSFAESWISIASKGLQSIDEIYMLIIRWNIDRAPGELSRADMNFWVQRRKMRLQLFAVDELGSWKKLIVCLHLDLLEA